MDNNKKSKENLEQSLNEILEAEETVAIEKEFIRDEEIKSDGKLLHYTRVVLSGMFDQLFAVAFAIVLFGITTLALKVFGYRIVSEYKDQVFLIIYIISNSLYYPLIAEFMHGKTLGKKIIFR